MTCTLGLTYGETTRQMHASGCPKARTRACCNAVAEVLEPMRVQEICFGAVYQQPLLFRWFREIWAAAALLPPCLCSLVSRLCLLPVLLVISFHM